MKESKIHMSLSKKLLLKGIKNGFLINSSPLVGSNKYKGVLIILNDITLRKQLEKLDKILLQTLVMN